MLHQRIILKGLRYRTSRAAIRTFNYDYIQQPGTFIQQAHSTSSVKGKSCSASKIHVSSDLESMSTITTTKRENVNTLHTCNKDDTYQFHIKFVCHESNNKWYIKSKIENFNGVKVGVHYGHLRI